MRSVSLRKQKRRLLAITAALAAGGSLILASVYISREVSLPNLIDIDNFHVPSQSDVRQDLEHYYAHNHNGDHRPRGELVGCPTREAGLWFHCEFDYPTAQKATEITCVYIYVDEPCCSWEHWDTRRHIRGRNLALARAAQKANSLPSTCG